MKKTNYGIRSRSWIKALPVLTLLTILLFNAFMVNAKQTAVYVCNNEDGTYTFIVKNFHTWEPLLLPTGEIDIDGTEYTFTSWDSILPPCAELVFACADQEYPEFIYQSVTVALGVGTHEITFPDNNDSNQIDNWNCLLELPLEFTVEDTACDLTVSLGPDIYTILNISDTGNYIVANVTGGTPPYTYYWSTGDDVTTSSSSDSFITYSSTDVSYEVFVRDAGGCTGLDKINIVVADLSCGRRSNRFQICWTNRRGVSRDLCVRQARAERLIGRGTAVWGPCPATPNVDPNWDEGTETEIVSDNIYLHAFPNPFSDQLIIEFEVIETDNVMVNVLNLQGQLLATVHDGHAEEGELVTTQFNAGNLPAGIYLIQVINAETTMVKKVVLTK